MSIEVSAAIQAMEDFVRAYHGVVSPAIPRYREAVRELLDAETAVPVRDFDEHPASVPEPDLFMRSHWPDEVSPPVPVPSDPKTLEDALHQLEVTRTQLAESRKSVSDQYADLRKLRDSCDHYKRGYEALGELLSQYFADRGDGWYRSVLIAAEDFDVLLRAAGQKCGQRS